MKTKIIIVSPSLDPKQNVSGISSVTQFIISNNPDYHYIHFELGRKDNESGGLSRVKVIMKTLVLWNRILNRYPEALVHYNFPLSKMSILRDPLFMIIARWKRRKMVIHLHGGIFLTTPHIPKYLKCILQSVFSFSFPCIVLSYLEKKIVVERFHCKNVYVLPNCVDLNNARNFHREYLDNKNVLTLGYLGRIAETKGIEYLLEACVELKRRNIPERFSCWKKQILSKKGNMTRISRDSSIWFIQTTGKRSMNLAVSMHFVVCTGMGKAIIFASTGFCSTTNISGCSAVFCS